MNLNATILGQAVSFILFVFICMRYVWPPLIDAIEKRQKRIADDLAYVEKAKKDLEIAKAQAKDHLNLAKIEAKMIIDQAIKHRMQLLSSAKVEAKEERDKIIAQAHQEIDVERNRAREELRKQVTTLALAISEKIIERSIDEATHSDIIDKTITEL